MKNTKPEMDDAIITDYNYDVKKEFMVKSLKDESMPTLSRELDESWETMSPLGKICM